MLGEKLKDIDKEQTNAGICATGAPTKEKLEELGLGWAADLMEG
jgi:hypothetical protein